MIKPMFNPRLESTQMLPWSWMDLSNEEATAQVLHLNLPRKEWDPTTEFGAQDTWAQSIPDTLAKQFVDGMDTPTTTTKDGGGTDATAAILSMDWLKIMDHINLHDYN